MLRFGDITKLRRIYVKDISQGGMFVRSRRPQSEGAKVQVVLELPDGSRFPLEGEVVSVRQPENGIGGNGIRFTNLTDARLSMLESYIDAFTAGVPNAMVNDESDISLVNVIEREAEERLQAKLSQTATSLAALMGNDAAPPRTPKADFLLRLDRALREVEELSSNSAYEILGVEERASFDDVRLVLNDRLADFTVDEELGRLPGLLAARIDAAKAKLWGAAGILCDPAGRAALDIGLGRLQPATVEPSVHEAFEEELRRRRSAASEAERAEFALAEPYLELAQEKQAVGDLKGTRSLLRAALMYDPHNLGIRKAVAAVRDELREATASASPPPLRAVADHESPPRPRSAPPPPPASEPEGLAELEPLPEPSEEVPAGRSRVGLIVAVVGVAAVLAILAVTQLGGSGDEPGQAEVAAAAAPETAAQEEKAPAPTGPAAPSSAENAAASETGEATEGEAEPEAEPEQEEGADEAPADEEEPVPSGDDPFSEVRALLDGGDFDGGFVLARKLRRQGHDNNGLRWMTVARCHQKDGVQARQWYRRLVGQNTRKIVRERCEELGIDVTAKGNGPTPREMYYRALEAEEAGNHTRACYLANQSNYKEPSVDTMVMAGKCACREGKPGRAKKLHRLLTPAERPRLEQGCKEFEIEL